MVLVLKLGIDILLDFKVEVYSYIVIGEIYVELLLCNVVLLLLKNGDVIVLVDILVLFDINDLFSVVNIVLEVIFYENL